MKKKFAKLPKKEKERAEAAYHQMKPADFNETMTASTRRSPNAIRLPNRLANKLRNVARLEGKPEYQAMVKTWIEERLQQKAKIAR